MREKSNEMSKGILKKVSRNVSRGVDGEAKMDTQNPKKIK